MSIYAYPDVIRNVRVLFEEAIRKGEARVRWNDGQVLVIRPELSDASPLDIEGIDLGITTNEILECIHEGREHQLYQSGGDE